MNELRLNIGCGAWLYFPTDQQSAVEAMREFETVCEKNGINTDNLEITSAILRDENGKDISTWSRETRA